MTPRFARLAGWLLLAGVVGTVVACSTPTVDGTDIDSASEGATAGKRPKRTTSSKTTAGDDDDDTAPAKTGGSTTPTPKPSSSTPTAPATTATTTPPTSSTTVTPPPATTTPAAPTQPNCQSGDPTACLECCLNANPGAVPYEDDYEACMESCPPGDDLCLDDCQRQHVSTCSGNAACSKNHACMEANNCLAQNFCNPI